MMGLSSKMSAEIKSPATTAHFPCLEALSAVRNAKADEGKENNPAHILITCFIFCV